MPCKVAIVGAYSLVGKEILKTLSDRSFPLTQIRLFDIDHSVGQHLMFENKEVLVEEVSEHVLREEKFSIVFFTGGSQLSQDFISIALGAGSKVLDLSSYSRNNLKAPIVVSQINSGKIKESQVISNPICLSTQLSLVLNPIHKIMPLNRVVVSSYQSVSGAGYLGVEELERQVNEIEDGKEAITHCFPKQIAFNVIPQVGQIMEDNWSREELIVADEVRSLLDADFDISVTGVVVPVLRGHSAVVMIELEKELTIEQIQDCWKENNISVYEDDVFTPWDLEGTNDLGVARLRQDRYRKNCYHFWTTADNLTVGSSLNATLIAEEWLK